MLYLSLWFVMLCERLWKIVVKEWKHALQDLWLWLYVFNLCCPLIVTAFPMHVCAYASYVGRAQKKSEREAGLKQRYVFCAQLDWRMLYWALLKSHLHISASTTSVCIATALVARKLNGCTLQSFNSHCCHSCIGCTNLLVAWYTSNACLLHHLLSATDGYASGLMRRGGIEGKSTRA